jgi:hypothetical protein
MSWDKLRDALTILVIPVLLWGVRLETRLAVHDRELAEATKTANNLEKLVDTIHRQQVKLGTIETKLELIYENSKRLRAE